MPPGSINNMVLDELRLEKVDLEVLERPYFCISDGLEPTTDILETQNPTRIAVFLRAKSPLYPLGVRR